MQERILYQLSDLPWLLVAGVIGLALESLLIVSGALRPDALWVALVEVVVLYGLVLGFIGFRFGRGAPGVAVGAAVGLIWGALFLLLGLESWATSSGAWTGPLMRTLVGAAVPGWSHRLVDPLLLRGALGRLASHHPRYAHLRKQRAAPTG